MSRLINAQINGIDVVSGDVLPLIFDNGEYTENNNRAVGFIRQYPAKASWSIKSNRIWIKLFSTQFVDSVVVKAILMDRLDDMVGIEYAIGVSGRECLWIDFYKNELNI